MSSEARRSDAPSTTCTFARVATRPPVATLSAVSVQPESLVLAIASRTISIGAPRSSSAPSSISPDRPENGFSQRIMRVGRRTIDNVSALHHLRWFGLNDLLADTRIDSYYRSVGVGRKSMRAFGAANIALAS